jgi:ferritin-like metal-binding protein YciE
MHVGNYLGLVHHSEQQLSNAFTEIAKHHGDEPDIYQTCQLLSSWSQRHVEALKPVIDRYSEEKSDEPERLTQTLFEEPRSGSLALLRDLHDLWLLAQEVSLCWIVLLQAARALRDKELEAVCEQFDGETRRQISWLMTRIKHVAPQTLVVAA